MKLAHPCSYFDQSSSDSGEEGETEEAIKQRIAKEFGFGDQGRESSSEEGGGASADEDDPLEAFMAGIEVRGGV